MSEHDFFFKARRSVSRIEGLEISHPSFSRSFFLVRNPNPWMKRQALGHGGGVVREYEYLPMRMQPKDTRGDLDFGMRVDLGDLGEIIPSELQRVIDAGTSHIKPTVIYRAWRSDKLSEPMIGPIVLQADEISRTRDGSSFEAVAPYLNLTRTGEAYTVDRFWMLRGFL
ncbi:hypothetical protein ACLPHZ_17860 [Alcaligenaceae bacterium Me47]